MFNNMKEVERTSLENGSHWFETKTMLFFGSSIKSKLMSYGNRQFFITSEQVDWEGPKLYTIREVLQDCEIDTYGEFRQFESLESAKKSLENDMA